MTEAKDSPAVLQHINRPSNPIDEAHLDSTTVEPREKFHSALAVSSNDGSGLDATEPAKKPQDFPRGPRFWAIIISLGVTNLLGALENTVVTTSAPTIVADLGLGEKYIWITNAFFLCRSVPGHRAWRSHRNVLTWVSETNQCSLSAAIRSACQRLWEEMGDSLYRCHLHSWKRHLWRREERGHVDRRSCSTRHRVRGHHHDNRYDLIAPFRSIILIVSRHNSFGSCSPPPAW